MHQISKTYRFEAAHQLKGHEGQCARLHGHSYIVEIGFKSDHLVERGSSRGMIIDFSHVSEVVRPLIIDRFDHRFIVQGDEPAYKALKLAGIADDHCVVLGVRTTAENLARWIYRELDDLDDFDDLLSYVRVWETATSMAEYRG